MTDAHRLMLEIRDLMRRPPEGVEYIEREDSNSLSEIHALISGPGNVISPGNHTIYAFLSFDSFSQREPPFTAANFA